MEIRTHIGVSVNGFVATPDGRPTFLGMPGFVPGESYGHPEFIDGCDAVLMGRTTFEPALGAPRWPWPEKRVYVLTSRPLPEMADPEIVFSESPDELLELMHAADFTGDVHLVGGPQTIDAFRALGALSRLGVVVLPILLREGLPLTPAGNAPIRLALEFQRTFSDGAVELVYAVPQ